MKELRNYTSSVPANRSILKIKKLLVDVGAKEITEQFEEGGDFNIKSLRFKLEVEGKGNFVILIDANIDKVYEKLIVKRKRRTADIKAKVYQQACRTAWKNMWDWTDLQLSLIDYDQAEVLEIFLPFLYNEQSQMAFYKHLKINNFKQLSE